MKWRLLSLACCAIFFGFIGVVADNPAPPFAFIFAPVGAVAERIKEQLKEETMYLRKVSQASVLFFFFLRTVFG